MQFNNPGGGYTDDLTTRSAGVPKFQPNPNNGPGDVIVRGKLGGTIFGFEVDPNATEGWLCESLQNPDGTVTAGTTQRPSDWMHFPEVWVGRNSNPEPTPKRALFHFERFLYCYFVALFSLYNPINPLD